MDTVFGVLENDGSSVDVSKEELADLQQRVSSTADAIKRNYESGYWGGSWNTRHCLWANQGPDGRKREEYYSGTDDGPRPFDGATDARAREADLVINEKAEALVLAGMMSTLKVQPVGKEDAQQAGNLKLMIEYYLQKMGLRRVRELCRLANFMVGSSPGAAVMRCEWRREKAVELQELSLEELAMMAVAVQVEGLPEEQIPLAVQESVDRFISALVDPEQDEGALSELILRFFPSLKPARAERMVKEIRTQIKRGDESVMVEFPVEYVRIDEPELTALEIGRDIFIPWDTDDFEEGWGYFTSDLLTKAEVKTRAKEEGWSESAVEELLRTEGDADRPARQGRVVLQRWRRHNGQWVQEYSESEVADRYEIITAVFRSVTVDGVPGVFQVRFAMDVSEALTKRELRKDKHGRYPAVAFAREYIDRMLVNSRGIADLEEPQQGLMKLYLDTCGDNAQFAGVPPLISIRAGGRGRKYIEPMDTIQVQPGGKFDWMNIPQYPASALKMMRTLEKRRNEYWGRLDPELDALQAAQRQRFEVLLFLSHLREVYVMLGQLIQQYAPEDVVMRVLDGAGRLARSREDIQGQFDVWVDFDVDVLNPDVLDKKLSMLKNVLLTMDSSMTVDRNAVVEYFMWMMNPGLARGAIRTPDDAAMSELKDEATQYQNVRAGLPTPMPTDGTINAPVRLMMYENMQQADPEVFNDMAQDKRAKLEERIQYLMHQAQQYGENAQTGRTGVAATMGGIMSGAVRG